MITFDNAWDNVLKDEFTKPYYLKLRQFLKEEYLQHIVYPDPYKIYEALKLTSYDDVLVVILGQDPYHNPHQAHGLAFSVPDGIPFPPSLRNIFLELQNELGFPIPKSGNLENWARQGVLLLNTALTVRKNQPNSHKGYGWEIFTSSVISHLNEREKPVIFVLWGNDAKKKRELITLPHHYVLMAAHPSPLSAYNGFFGCGHFKKINEILRNNNIKEIDWNLNKEAK